MLENFSVPPTTLPASPMGKLGAGGSGSASFFRVRTRRNLQPPVDLRATVAKVLHFEAADDESMRCTEDALPHEETPRGGLDCRVLQTTFVDGPRIARTIPGGVGMYDVNFHEALAGGAIFSPNMFYHMARA